MDVGRTIKKVGGGKCGIRKLLIIRLVNGSTSIEQVLKVDVANCKTMKHGSYKQKYGANMRERIRTTAFQRNKPVPTPLDSFRATVRILV
jgi:hypothetical protein